MSSTPQTSEISKGAKSFKKQWKISRKEEPGKRFQHLHGAWREATSDQPAWIRLIVLLAGVLLILLGMAFWFIPGPATFFLIPGAILLAAVSGFMARVVDLIEKAINPAVERFVAFWKRASRPVKWAVEIGFLALGGLIYYVVFG